ALSGLGQAQQALYYAERARRAAPGDPRANIALGECLAACGRRAEAEALYRECMAAHPENPAFLGFLAEMLMEQDRFVECAELCEAGMARHGGEPRLAGVYASSLIESARAGEAVAVLRRAIASGPDEATESRLRMTLCPACNYAPGQD